MDRILIIAAAIVAFGHPTGASGQDPIAQLARTTTRAVALSPEMAKLSRYVGRWSVTMQRKSENKTLAATSEAKWVLGGRFLQSTYEGDGIDGMMLTTYDPKSQRYRRWQFDAAGAVTEFAGKWDEGAKTLHFEHVSKDKSYRIVVESICSENNAGETFSIVVKDRDGQELDEFSGSSQRIQ